MISVLTATETTPEQLLAKYRRVRAFTEELCRPLATEDYVVQSMADVSPTKWHISHVSWFFEQFVLVPKNPGYRSPDPQFAYLFNSYYVQAGPRFLRPRRGLLTRPTVEEAYRYRAHVDRHMEEFISGADEERFREVGPVIELGLNHEQQHQELILTDIKHVLSQNPLSPVYRERVTVETASSVPDPDWVTFSEGVYEIGHEGEGFAYDNEGPRHRVFLEPFRLATRLVTNGEYIGFIEDGGYKRSDLWLSEGWATVEDKKWEAPLYWSERDGDWWMMTLAGLRRVERTEPVCHLSYFEASAYAMWADARLPTEAEWEIAAGSVDVTGNFVDEGHYHPVPLGNDSAGGLNQMFGDVWEWTQSHYSPYPGYKAAPGAIGEYNGKFMCNQFVLRGGACTTSRDHFRLTYRNFLPAYSQWFFSGLRLAEGGGAS